MFEGVLTVLSTGEPGHTEEQAVSVIRVVFCVGLCINLGV